MKRKIMILLAACVAAAPLQAQNLEFGGLTYNNDLMMSTDFAALSKTAFTMLFVTFGFASLVLVRDAEPLRYLLIFIAAWSTDTFALFAGKFFGRRKLCEHISPKKTVAGAVGGVIGCVAAFAVYALAVDMLYGIRENYLLLALLAVCGSAVSMLGDLAASVIKRAFGVKDYGNIFPGHGGVLDRFDSMLFVAPFVYVYVSFIGIL